MATLRPIVGEDGDAFQAFVRGLSVQSRLHRFLFPVKELGPGALAALTQPDQALHVGLVAVAGGEIVGEGRYVTLGESGRAEFAIAVADAWQRQGIGAHLLDALMASARRAGLHALEGEVLRTNTGMLEFMKRAGFRRRRSADDARLTIVERELPVFV
jgi:acetyltransferase